MARKPSLQTLLRRAKAEGWREFVRSENDERAVLEGCYYDADAAEHVCQFFREFLRHSVGPHAGEPFDLLDWQREEFLGPLFGWKRANATRRFRQAGVWIPKKNGKSALGSGLVLYGLVADGEMGAGVYCAAADKNQASIVYDEAVRMVKASPELDARIKLVESQRRMVFAATSSIYQVLSSDVPSKEGINWSMLVFDEIHAQPTSELWDTLMYGNAARSQPLLVSISTAGYDKNSLGYKQYDYAKRVAAGTVPSTEFLPVIYEAAADDDWTEPATWRKANPSIDVTVQLDELASKCAMAKEMPSEENKFKRYRLNLWTEQATRWLPMDKWDACGEEAIELAALNKQLCYAGLDLASTEDLTALVLAFPREGGYDLVPHFWIPEEGLQKRVHRDRVPYDLWAREGLITVTPGPVTDYARVRADINALANKYSIAEIAIDRLFQGAQLASDLLKDGLEVIAFGQGFFSMAAPTKECERLVLDGKLRHGGHEVLRWMAANVAVETDPAGNLKPSKKKSTERIDGIVATIMAIGRAMVRPEHSSIYSKQGLDYV